MISGEPLLNIQLTIVVLPVGRMVHILIFNVLKSRNLSLAGLDTGC